MSDEELLQRIVTSPGLMAGKAVIKGTRLTVEFVVNLLAHGATVQDILDEYPGLHSEDIHACLLFAAQSVASTRFLPLTAEPA